jgi:hypothetical protein
MWWGGGSIQALVVRPHKLASIHSRPQALYLSAYLPPLSRTYCTVHLYPLFINESVPSKRKNLLGNRAMFFVVFH